MNCVIAFDSIHRIMKAEKILTGEGLSMTLVPTPRHISSDCGMVIQVACDDLKRAQEILQESGLTIEGVYELGK